MAVWDATRRRDLREWSGEPDTGGDSPGGHARPPPYAAQVAQIDILAANPYHRTFLPGSPVTFCGGLGLDWGARWVRAIDAAVGGVPTGVGKAATAAARAPA